MMQGPGTAAGQELSQLITLWQRCFGESPEESACYLQHRFHPEEIYVWRIDGAVRAMIHLIPVIMNGLKGGYLYAIATDPDVQGRGICRRLHEYLRRQAQADGYDFLCLIPASIPLFSFYERLGYKTWFWKEQYEMTGTLQGSESCDMDSVFCSKPVCAAPDVKPVFVPCSPSDYLPSLLSAPLTYLREEDMRTALDLHEHYEGIFLKCTGTPEPVYAAGYCEDRELILNHCTDTRRAKLLPAASRYALSQGCTALTLLFQTDECPDRSCSKQPVRSPYAMGLWLTEHSDEPIPDRIGFMYT